jgi:hypothetical protein
MQSHALMPAFARPPRPPALHIRLRDIGREPDVIMVTVQTEPGHT